MRVAAGSALLAARPIAQMVWRVDIAARIPHILTVKVPKLGKVRVNRR